MGVRLLLPWDGEGGQPIRVRKERTKETALNLLASAVTKEGGSQNG